MSDSTNNIVIQIADSVAPSIEPRIRGIAAAARDANVALSQTKTALGSLDSSGASAATAMSSFSASSTTTSTAIKGLNTAVNDLPKAVVPAVASVGRMESSLAQLMGRVVGAESGFGMLGGAFARVGVAAGLAGPLIIAALAIGAIVGAILWYNSAAKAALALTEAQTKLAEQFGEMKNRIMEQNEAYAQLLGGPFAKYKQELADLSSKAITINFESVNKLLDTQNHWWQNLIGSAETYAHLLATLGSGGRIAKEPAETTSADAKQFIASQDLKRSVSADTKQALITDIAEYKEKLNELATDEASQFGMVKTVTMRSGEDLKAALAILVNEQTNYNNTARQLSGELALSQIAIEKQSGDERAKVFETAAKHMSETDQTQVMLRMGLEKQAAGIQLAADSAAINAKLELAKKDKSLTPGAMQAAQGELAKLQADYRIKLSDIDVAYYDKEKKLSDDQIKHDQENTAKATESSLKAELAKAEGLAAIRKAELQSNIDDAKSAQTEMSDSITQDKADKQILKQVADQQKLIQAIKDTRDAKLAQNTNDIQGAEQGMKAGFASGGLDDPQYLKAEKDYIDFQAKRVSTNEEANKAIAASGAKLEKSLNAQMKSAMGMDSNVVEGLQAQLLLLNTALTTVDDQTKKTQISQDAYKASAGKVTIELANEKNATGSLATNQTVLIGSLSKVMAGYQGLASGISKAYGDAFAKIADGAATSLSKAIVYGENLGKAFKDLARTIIQELLQAFIKLGIQWLINEALGHAIKTAELAAVTAQMQAIALAAAPAAAMTSLATSGANGIGADAAMTTTNALAATMALAGGKASGGYLSGAGTWRSDSIPIAASNGEFIVNAAATSQNRDALEAMNNGRGSTVGSGSTMNVHVQHDGSTNIQTQQVDANTVRIIAKQEAQSAVQTHAPAVIAADMQNPNSRTSKALSMNVVAPRRR